MTALRACRPATNGERRGASRPERQSGRKKQRRRRGRRPSSTPGGCKAPPEGQKRWQQRRGPPPLVTTIKTCRFPQPLSITVQVLERPEGPLVLRKRKHFWERSVDLQIRRLRSE